MFAGWGDLSRGEEQVKTDGIKFGQRPTIPIGFISQASQGRWTKGKKAWRFFESPLDSKEVKVVNPKGNQPWIFIGRTDVGAEAPILWPPDAKSWLIRKDHDAGKDWGQEKKGTPEDEMVGWCHQLNGHGFEYIPGVCDGRGGLACCSPWDHKVRHDLATEQKLIQKP